MALINYITTIQFDFGAIQLIPAECERLGIGKPLVVTDKGLRATGLLDAQRGVYVGAWCPENSNRLHYLRHNGPEQ